MFKGLWVNGLGDGYGDVRALRAVEGGGESDPLDAAAAHVVVYDGEGVPCATGRLYPDESGWRIDRVFVTPPSRGQGYGDLVMRMLLFRAVQTYDDADIFARASASVRPFLARYGFEESAGGEMKVRGRDADLRGSCIPR